jgi:hypothetical protein
MVLSHGFNTRMSASSRSTGASGCRRWSRPLAVLALASGSAFAQVVAVPLAHLNHAEGSVAYAPQGDTEWHDVQPRRVLKRGDRLWIDRGSRAEVQAGGHALRLDGQTQIVLENVSDTATQISLTQGSLAATVTRVNPGDTFEVGTPNLAFRARQAGDYRIDADPKQGTTRIFVLAGSGVVYGEQGEALEIRTGQRMVFRNRDLTRVHTPAFVATDDFDRWVAARRRGEPTVSMPTLAAAPAQPTLPAGPVSSGRTIVIPGNGPAPAGRGSLATAKLPPVKAAAALAAQQPAPRLAPATAMALPPAHPAPAQPVLPAARAIAATAPAAAPLRVSAPDTPPAAHVESAVLPPLQLPPALQAQAAAAQAAAQAQAAAAQAAAAAKAQAAREARDQARERERERVAQQRAERADRAERAEREKRAALEARRSEGRKRSAVAAKRAEEERRQAQARHEQGQKRLAARRAEEDRRHALARRAAEEKEKKLAAARKAAEDQKLAAARRRQLARLREQAAREEQAAKARREQQARKAEEDREKRDELARREEADRRQRALIEQARRDQERRDEEVWLRQQQLLNPPPMRPVPMGVPFVRRVS